MKAPVFFLQLDAVLSKKDAQSIREALDYAYSMGYKDGEKAAVVYAPPTNRRPISVPPSYPFPPSTWSNNAGSTTTYSYCPHAFVTAENKKMGICGKCGISFDKWHG